MSWPRHSGPLGPIHTRRDELRRNGLRLRAVFRNPFDTNGPFREVEAVVDTGASCVLVNKRMARELGLMQTGTTELTAVGAQHKALVYSGQLSVPELDFDKFLPVVVPSGVSSPVVLLGRSFLEHFSFTYCGLTGTCTFHNAADTYAYGPPEEPDG